MLVMAFAPLLVQPDNSTAAHTAHATTVTNRRHPIAFCIFLKLPCPLKWENNIPATSPP